jgi:hypothetical protein
MSAELRSLAPRLGGDVSGRGVICPGPGHSARDRSLSVTLSCSISDRHSQECAKKDFWHGALVKIAKQKGYAKAHGWAAHKFREKFGHWPTLNYPPEREPTVEIINWVRSRNIAFAKARQRYG